MDLALDLSLDNAEFNEEQKAKIKVPKYLESGEGEEGRYLLLNTRSRERLRTNHPIHWV